MFEELSRRRLYIQGDHSMKIGFFDRWFLGITDPEEDKDKNVIARQSKKIKKLEKALQAKAEEE